MTPDETLVAEDELARAFAIGRDPANDIVIKDTQVSRQQALVTVLGNGRYHLVDRGSANGTFVLRDGRWVKVEAAEVLADDRIRFGDRVMVVAALFAPPPQSADIFISYSSADRDIARMVAEVFSAEGWNIWWDQVIPPGKNYDEVIEEQVASARCVVVLWSKTSVSSRWVRAEAGDAMGRDILIPALIENTPIPLVFRQLQAVDLMAWSGQAGHPGLARLVDAVRATLTPHRTLQR